MKQNKIAIIYDFDGTLTPKSMQEYTLLPKLGIKSKSFWELIVKEARETGGESMMVYMRQLLDHAKIKNNVLFVGLGSTFQIWDPKNFEKFKIIARKKAHQNRSSFKWDNNKREDKA